MARLLYGAIAALAIAVAMPAIGEPHKHGAPAKVKPCKRQKYRYIGKERVPWDHDEDDHEWEEFDHTTDECEPPPC